MASTDSDTQSPVFWERLRGLFTRSEGDPRSEARRRATAIAACLFISCLLWFVFTLQENYTAVIEVETEVTNLPSDQALVSRPPATARVQMRGQGFQLLRLALDPPTVLIDAEAGQINLETKVNLPRDVEMLSVSPRVLELQKEPRVVRRLPVRLRAEIETPSTHDLVDPPSVRPDSVRISGAASIVEGLTYWPTDSLRVSGLKDTLSALVPLADTLEGLISHSVEAVEVTARARQYTEGTREIDVRVPGSPERSVTLEPSAVQVRYRVPVAQYRQAQQAPDFFATVSYDEIRADTTGRVRPQLHLPPDLDIRNAEVIPSTLRYYNFVTGE